MRKILVLLIISCFLLLLMGAILFGIYYSKLPDVTELRNKHTQAVNIILDSDDQLLEAKANQDTDYIIFEQLPKYLVAALLAVEDQRFFQHQGVDFLAIPRAAFKNLQKGAYVQGASSITQQLAKLYFLTPEKSFKRKFVEMLLAFKIEYHFTKQEIIELYLNKAYFGSGYYGIAQAARGYFAKSVEQLDIQEAALLVGLLKAPSRFSPKANPDLAKARTEFVLQNMLKHQLIDETDLMIAAYSDNAWHQKFNESNNQGYYLDLVAEEAKEQAEIFPFNVKLHTGYDQRLNQFAESEILELFNTDVIPDDTQIALLAMRYDGRIAAVIGGRNYKESQFNRAFYAKRQPGSLFKLFTYLTALQQGHDIAEAWLDEPITIDDWQPKNYEEKYHGQITLREAFVRSVNSVAVKLALAVTIPEIIKTAQKIGIANQLPNMPSLALGTGEVTLLEMVKSYAVIANGGYQVEPHLIHQISDDYANALYNFTPPHRRVVGKQYVNDLQQLLRGVVVWGTGKNAEIPGLEIRGKTGTSQNSRDAWFVGFSHDLVLGIWLGHDENQEIGEVTGGSVPALLFREIMQQYYVSN